MGLDTVRDTLRDQQRLLDGNEWPPWVIHGVPVFALLVGAIAVLEHNQTEHFKGTDASPTLAATLLIACAVLPWIVCWRPPGRKAKFDLQSHTFAFAIAVLVPLATLHVAGDWLGITTIEPSGPQLSLMLLVLLVVQTASHAPMWVVAFVEASALGIVFGRALQAPDDGMGAFSAWALAVVLMGFGGLAMRTNFVTMQRLREAREELARQAVADERRRVAREVHDVVAHTLSVTMLHVTAARLAVERAPDRAVAALEEAERQGRAGMSDIRRMVGLLRAVDEGADASGDLHVSSAHGRSVDRALPTLDELPDLIARYNDAGLDVDIELDLEPDRTEGALDGQPAVNGSMDPYRPPAPERLSPAVGLALYRLVQESLTNAAKHGSGGAQVRLSMGTNTAALTVRNPCVQESSADEAGSGLTGMRERVVGLGGSFRAGHVNGGDGGQNGGATIWEVQALMPLGADG